MTNAQERAKELAIDLHYMEHPGGTGKPRFIPDGWETIISATMAQVEAETRAQQDGLTITHGEDGWWLNFDGGEGQPKSGISLQALGDGSLRGCERPGILAWIERQQAQRAKEGKG